MAKNYICKECIYNNHGWCNKLKKQGLSTIFECIYFQGGSMQEEKRRDDLEYAFQVGKMLGSRETLFSVFKQLHAAKIKNIDLNYEEWLDILKNIEVLLSSAEVIYGISEKDLESQVDKDIYLASKKIRSY